MTVTTLPGDESIGRIELGDTLAGRFISPESRYGDGITTTTPQRPIGSGFDSTTTAAEVLAGIDLTDKLAILTGGYSGIGIEDTRGFSAAGATVLVPARRPDYARQQLAGIERVEVESLDLADLESIRDFAQRFLERGRSIEILVNNAAVMANPETRVGKGWESQLATNHLGHFALTNRLWPALTAKSGARVISVSSRGHKFSPMRWDDLQFESGYDKWQAYGQSKTANVLFAVELDRLGRDAGVRAFSVYPGGILTSLQRHLGKEEMVALGWIDEEENVILPFKSPEQGAATSAWAATSPLLDGKGGVYCEDCDIAVVADPKAQASVAGVNPWAIDPGGARRLWTVSAELTKVDAFTASG